MTIPVLLICALLAAPTQAKDRPAARPRLSLRFKVIKPSKQYWLGVKNRGAGPAAFSELIANYFFRHRNPNWPTVPYTVTKTHQCYAQNRFRIGPGESYYQFIHLKMERPKGAATEHPEFHVSSISVSEGGECEGPGIDLRARRAGPPPRLGTEHRWSASALWASGTHAWIGLRNATRAPLAITSLGRLPQGKITVSECDLDEDKLLVLPGESLQQLVPLREDEKAQGRITLRAWPLTAEGNCLGEPLRFTIELPKEK